MAMAGVRSSLAALLFLTLVVLAAASASGGGDDDDAAVEKKEKQCYRPLAADEPYALLAFQNKDGEEIRLLADQRTSSELLSGGSISAFANRSGHWIYAGKEAGNKGSRRRRRLVPLHNRSRAEGLWNTLGVLVNTDDDELASYMLVGMQTSGGDKIRLVVVADHRYFFITGYAKGFSNYPRWSFRDGERHHLLTTLGSNGSSSSHGSGGGGGGGSSSHAELVASRVLATMMNDGKF